MESKRAEKVEETLGGRLKILRGDEGYRHAIDPFLLCSFCEVRPGDVVVDLGCAEGVIPLLLAEGTSLARAFGVELQAGLAERARENVLLNNLQGKVEIVNGDLRSLPDGERLQRESADVVVSNPPYRKVGTGKVAPEGGRAACRHELNGTIDDFLAATVYLLKNKGRGYFIYLPERLPELMGKMVSMRLEPKRLRCVHSRAGSNAVMVLVECRKNGKPGIVIDPPLNIYDGDGYSPEVLDIFNIDAG